MAIKKHWNLCELWLNMSWKCLHLNLTNVGSNYNPTSQYEGECTDTCILVNQG